MKKMLITFILLFSIINNVYALDSYGDVKGKYLYENNSNFYRVKIIPNNKVNVETSDINFSISADNYLDSIDMVLIKSSNELLHFDNISNNAIIYYIDFYQNNLKVTPKGTIKISSNNNLDYSVVSFYNINGTKKSEINLINDKFTLNVTHSGYIIIEKNVLNEIDIESKYGNLMIDGIAYNEKYYTKKDNLSLVIVPIANYKTKKIEFNDEIIELNGGFNTVNLSKKNKLKVFYEKDEVISEKTFSISGKVLNNNTPVAGAKVVLHSTEKISYTSADGSYNFNDVEFGFHTLSIFIDDLLVGYKEFEVFNKKVSNVIQITGSKDIIEFDQSTVELRMNLLMNDDMTLKLSNISNSRLGDVNLDNLVNISDLINLREYLVDLIDFDSIKKKLADVNRDNIININDVIKMRKYLAGLENL